MFILYDFTLIWHIIEMNTNTDKTTHMYIDYGWVDQGAL